MKNSDKKYNEIINELKDTNPVLQNKKELTDEIISTIKNKNRSTSKSHKIFIRIIRPAMTAAAVFLVGLFLFQQPKKNEMHQNETFAYPNKQDQSVVLEQLKTNEINLPNDLKICLKAAEMNYKKMDSKCAAKLFLYYKKQNSLEKQFRKKKIMNFLNH